MNQENQREWKEFGTLEKLLQVYGEEELTAIAKTHHVDNADKLNENDRITCLREQILNELEMKNFFLCVQEEEIEAFEKMLYSPFGIYLEELTGELNYLLIGGYCGVWEEAEGESGFCVPKDVIAAYEKMNTKEFRTERKRMELIGTYCHGANNLYAVTPPKKVVELLNKYESEKTTEEEVVSAYETLRPYRCDFVYEDGLFIDEKLMENKQYVDLWERQQDSPFYIPSKEEIENLAQYDQTAITEEMRSVAQYLIDVLQASRDAVLEVCSIMQIVIRKGGKMEDVIELMADYEIRFQSEEQMEKFGNMLVNLWNHSRMVLNRGYTPAEMQEFE